MIADAQAWQGPMSRFQKAALKTGVVSLLAACVVGFFWRSQFFQSYLMGYFFFLCLPLGSLALAMTYQLTGGRWGIPIRRVFEAASRTIPLMALLFLPLLLGLHELYVWMNPTAVAGSPMMQHRAGYLNGTAWVLRAVAYFVVWLAISSHYNRLSAEQDKDPSPELIVKLAIFSGVGLAAYALTASFASLDWLMALQPNWYSSVYPMQICVGQLLVASCFAIMVTSWLSKREPLSRIATEQNFLDYGNILMVAVLGWGYLAYSQLIVIWSGNLPQENAWYVLRNQGVWLVISILVAVLHFATPFFILLFRQIKQQATLLVYLAGALFLVHLLVVWWLVEPSFSTLAYQAEAWQLVSPIPQAAPWYAHGLDILAPIGIGGVWLAEFCRQLMGRPLLALADPRVAEAAKAAHNG